MADEKVSLEAGSPLLPELPDWSEEELEQEFDTRITTIAAELEAGLAGSSGYPGVSFRLADAACAQVPA